MHKQNLEGLHKEVEKRYRKKDKKKKPTMKVSGAKVRNLQKIITTRGKVSKKNDFKKISSQTKV